jgi:hypothetical protein
MFKINICLIFLIIVFQFSGCAFNSKPDTAEIPER